MRTLGVRTIVVFAALLGLVDPAFAQSGGADALEPPKIAAVSCAATPDTPCGREGVLLRGRRLEISGSGLVNVTEIVFRGRRGRADDVTVRPDDVSAKAVAATVPERARSGKVTVEDRYGYTATAPARVTVSDAPVAPPVDLTPSSRFFFAARRKPTFSFEVSQPATVQVQLTNVDSGELVQTWSVPASPGAPQQVTWDGRAATAAAGPGNYRFQVVGEATSAARASAGAESGFTFADHLFPIRGRHNLGYTRTNNFGGGRAHKGQDMFARCGTRLAAARGGKVEYAGYHSAAGNYVVIDGADTGVDYVYMHMLEPPLVKTGQRVFTGQKLGEVGETGRATGCHLHFEMWEAPGWYSGGKAFDPLPSLETWDAYS